jgi:2-polyprenyl-6-hydroxyphenyl methylase/3-demethylubiquinone-9 3-methyltransferase
MKQLISFIRRKILRIPADRWDYQYGRGEWEGLANEHARFDAVIALIRENYSLPAILEIGCGKALMLQRLQQGDFSSFIGIDLSEVAIDYAKQYESDHIHFVCADMQTYMPPQHFDVIAFNESLYYAKDPAQVFANYRAYLKPGGSIIVTAFENKYTAKLWPALEKRWTPVQSCAVQVDHLVWNVRMYR